MKNFLKEKRMAKELNIARWEIQYLKVNLDTVSNTDISQNLIIKFYIQKNNI